MPNLKIEKYQQNLVDNLLEQMESNPNFLKIWSEIPFNPYNGKGLNLYNGINQINLSMNLAQTKSADPRYYTFKQIKDLNLKLKKGSKGVAVQYFNFADKEIELKDKTKKIKIPFVRLTHAFNAQDIEGLEPYEQTKGFAALKDNRDLTTKLDGIIKQARVKISHGGNRAFYHGGNTDEIMMPPPERFSSKEAYAATLLHELAHSTGHQSRQNRDMGDKTFDKNGYAKEELRAELSSVFMCQRLGISYQLENDQTHIENSAAYLKGWKSILKDDKAEFFRAAGDANKITAYLVDGKSFERAFSKPTDKTVNRDFQKNQMIKGVGVIKDVTETQVLLNNKWLHKKIVTSNEKISGSKLQRITSKLIQDISSSDVVYLRQFESELFKPNQKTEITQALKKATNNSRNLRAIPHMENTIRFYIEQGMANAATDFRQSTTKTTAKHRLQNRRLKNAHSLSK